LARALAIDPAVLLLDEPFGALDAQVRRDLRRWLRDLHDRTGYTTVFVTHDQEEALELADRVVVMSQGRIEQVGSADELYDAPASPFVFSFIGESSAVPVTVADGRVWFDGMRLSLSPEGTLPGPARLCLRPQDLDLVEPDSVGVLTGSVLVVRRNDSGRRIELAIGDDGARMEVEVPTSVSPAVGDRVGIRPRRWRIYAVDATSILSSSAKPQP
jgi:sulfate transport system ATP-binding protein